MMVLIGVSYLLSCVLSFTVYILVTTRVHKIDVRFDTLLFGICISLLGPVGAIAGVAITITEWFSNVTPGDKIYFKSKRS